MSTYKKIPGTDVCFPAVCGGDNYQVAAGPIAGVQQQASTPSKIDTFDVESVTSDSCGAATSYLDAAFPFLHGCHAHSVRVGKTLEPYRLGLLLPAALGLLLCFFGGSYMTLIAAVEAYRIAGWEKQLALVRELSDDMQVFVAASSEDDKVDADGDGIPDVQQQQGGVQQLAQRKALLFLKTVDPKRLGAVLGGLQSGLFAVVATLKLEFARAVTLGTVIQTMLRKPTDTFITPLLGSLLPEDYRHWAAELCGWAIKAVAISIAFTAQRIISAYYSALRGGRMFALNILEYLDKMNIVSINADESILDEVAGYAVAGLGIYWQLSMGFSVPFPLNIFLVPANIAEWALLWLVNSK